MNDRDKYFNDKLNIDSTGTIVGSEEYNRIHYPENIDPATGTIVGSEEYNRIHYPIKEDHLSDFGRGLYYKTCDGQEVATMEEVMAYNQMYYDKMMKKQESIDEDIRMQR